MIYLTLHNHYISYPWKHGSAQIGFFRVLSGALQSRAGVQALSMTYGVTFFFDPMDLGPQICEKRRGIFGTQKRWRTETLRSMCDPLQSTKTRI